MAALAPLVALAAITLVAAVAARFPAGWTLLAVAVPYLALAVFLIGVCARVVQWALAPVPFRIPTTCGQQKSLPWIKRSPLDSPSGLAGVLGRMALEILLFRSLFRNNRARLCDGRLVLGENKALWLAALAFHGSLLVILLRHLRLLTQPVPAMVIALQRVDGFLQVGTPEWYLSDLFLVAAGAWLLLRRFRDPLLRYASLFTDFFALYLLLAIAVSGILMRYVTRVDVVAVKQFALGIATFHPQVPANLGAMFLVHLLLVSALAVYFPFSKLMHMGGIFLSPTRNLANNNRRTRHLNPWNYPVATHSYGEWEAEFHDKLVAAGIPLEEEHAPSLSTD